MTKKKNNKKEQTFNVYPYLGGYQHFMRNGGALPKFEEQGAVDPSTIANRIKPTNKYKYANTYKGVVDEWKANNDPNYVPRGSFMGQLAGSIQAAGDFGKTAMGTFDKDNYKPGGKYSKHQTKQIAGRVAGCSDTKSANEEECVNNGGTWDPGSESTEVYDGLKYANSTFTNTTDENAILNTDNVAKYVGMSKREKKKFGKSGGRNTDLWWTPQEMADGKFNYMDLNEDGTPKFDGVNLRASIERGNALEEQTGDRMFNNKTRNKDGDFIYFDNDRNLIANQKGARTEYDRIEEGTGTGELGDANASQMNIQYEVDENGNPIDPANNQLTSFNHIGEDKDGNPLEKDDVVYDPNKEYGNYMDKKSFTINVQKEKECKSKGCIYVPDEMGGSCDCAYTGKYGTEIPEYLRGGGTAQSAVLCDAYDRPIEPHMAAAADVNNNYKGPGMRYGGALDTFVYGGALPKFQDGVEFNSGGLDMDMAEDPYGVNAFNTNPPIENPNANAEDPMMVVDESENSPESQPRVMTQAESQQAMYDESGLENPFAPREEATEEQQDMGIDAGYGDGLLEKTWNKSREFLNTGVMGAAKDTLIGGSAEKYCSDPKYTTKEECEKEGAKWTEQKGTGAVSLLFDNLMPMAENIMGQNAERKNEMYKRSVSAEDMYAATESGTGSGQRGFYDVNKGGYGDDLYGTGKIFGQIAQDGMEMQQEQPKDFSVPTSYMELEDGLKFDLESLKEQKNYLGKYNMGGHLPRFQDGKESKPWYSKVADYTQTALSGVGLTPGPIGFVADAINTGVSGTRAGYNTAIGDTESAKIHGENLALNATSMIPGPAGWAAGGTAIAKDLANYTGVTDPNKSVTTQVTDAVADKPQYAENLNTGPKKIGSAKHGGEQHVEMDMALYYELMQAGADIKIIR